MVTGRAPYRDASDGLRARAHELESELSQLGVPARRFPSSESGDDVARVALLEHALDDAERAFARRGQRWRWALAITVVVVLLGAMLAGARRELQRAELYGALPREGRSWASPPGGQRAYAVWRGTVVSGLGRSRSARETPDPLGKPCELAAGIETRGPGVVHTRIRLSCRGLRTLRFVSDDCRVNEWPQNAGWKYSLECRVRGEQGGLRIDTRRRSVARLERDGSWEEIEVPSMSEVRRGEPLFPPSRPAGIVAFHMPVQRTGRVTQALGRSGLSEGDRCTVDVVPIVSTGLANCRVIVHCGVFRPFGELSGRLGYQWCEMRAGRPISAFDGRAGTIGWPWANQDEAVDGDPLLALDLERGTMIVGHDLDEYVVYVELEPETGVSARLQAIRRTE